MMSVSADGRTRKGDEWATMKRFVKTASAVVLTAALWTGVSYSHALMVRAAASEAAQTVSASDIASVSSVRNVVSDEVYQAALVEEESAVLAESVTKLAITKQPTDYTGTAGSQAVFKVTASGDGLQYQWQLSDDGTNWRNSSTTSSQYTATLSSTNHGRRVRCVVTDSSGSSVTSNVAAMKIKGLLAITGQPTDYSGAAGDNVTFRVEASGSGLQYQWQLSDDGTNWRNSSVKTATYSTTLTTTNHGRRVRCIVTDSSGSSVTSNVAAMKIKGLLAITKQPTDYSGAAGDSVTFLVEASGTGLKYQWQLSDDGINWRNSSTKTAAYAATLSNTNNGRRVRCIVTDSSGGSVTSDTAMMSVKGVVVITKQPVDFVGAAGSSVKFTVAASRKDVSYQWQISEDGVTWRNSSTKAAEYAVTLSEKNNGRRARCIVTDADGNIAISNAAIMSVKGVLTITKQPADCTGEAGSQASFSVAASQKGAAFQWQLSDDNGVTWRNSSTTSAAYTTTLTAANNGRCVRCVVTDASGNTVVSDVAAMKIEGLLAITGQPSDYTGEAGDKMTFTVTATGSGLQYRWQLSDDNGATWRNSSTTASTYATTLTATNNNRLVRCIVTDSSGNRVTSDAARMKIKAVFRITGQPADYVGEAGDKMSFRVEVEGYRLVYQWQLSDDDGANWRNSSTKTDTYATTLTTTNHNRFVRCVVTDIDGKTAVSHAARMSIKVPITVTTQPEGYAAVDGEQVEFRVTATGDHTLSYVWQLSDDNGFSWRDSSVTTASYWATASERVDGRWFRCVIRDDQGNELISKSAALHLVDSVTPGFTTRYGVRKYRYADGSYANGLTPIDGKWYYFVSQAMKTGVYSVNDALCYFDDETGAAITGLKYVESHGKYYWFQGVNGVVKGLHEETDGVRYFSPSTGTMQTGLRTIDGKYYYFEPATGLMYTGWYQNPEDGKTYYFLGMDGAAQGLTEIDGEIYYFNEFYVAKTGAYTFDGALYYFDEYSNAAKHGFYTTDYGDTYYFGDDGKAVSGWNTIDGDNYYFLANHTMSRGLTNIGGKRYYFDFETGAAIRTNSLVWIGMNQLMYIKAEGGYVTGLTNVNGALYYFSPENGIALSGMRKVDGSSYCFSEGSFEALTGFVDYNLSRYYFNSQCKMVTGMRTLNDGSGTRHTYYFDDSGAMVKGRVIMGDGSVYCFDENGRAMSGWYTYINGAKYYFDPETHRAVTGWQYIEASRAWFFFESNGTLKTGLIRNDDNVLYAYDPDGEPVQGWYVSGGSTYYFDPSDHKAVKGLVTIDGKTYYFLNSYKRQSGYFNFDGNYYYFDPVSGAAMTGFICAFNTGTGGACVYYGDPSTGVLVTGMKTINGALYCFNSAGVMRTGAYYAPSGEVYYFDPATGRQIAGSVTGGQWATSGRTRSYMDSNGNKVTGVVCIDGNFYCFDISGAMQTGLCSVNGGKAYFGDDGAMVTGWVDINGKSCYFDTATGLMYNGFANVDGTLCYFDENGAMQKNGFFTVGDRHYYADATGAIQTGLVTIDGKQYYFLDSGEQKFGRVYVGSRACYFDPTTGERRLGFVGYGDKLYYFDTSEKGFPQGKTVINGNTYLFISGDGSAYMGYCLYQGEEYYLNTITGESMTGIHTKPNGNSYYFVGDGTLARGLQTVDGRQYYFYPASGVKVDGLQSIGSKLYYFDEVNGMLTNQTVKVDGLEFRLADDGSATVLGNSQEAKLLRAGMEYLGRPYKSEVAGEDDILSCSGFVRQMYRAIGVDLAGSSYRQYFNLARENSTVNGINYASPGDLVFYVSLDCGHGDECGFLGEIHHVAMYVGGGKIIEANRNDDYPELSCIILQNYADSTTYFPYKIVSVLD